MPEFDMNEALAAVRRVVRSTAGVEEGLRRLTAYCHVKHPHPAWSRVLELDVRADVNALEHWFAGLLADEPPGPGIEAFWFGLYDAVMRNGREVCAMYVSGSTQFDPMDASAEWAEWAPDTYLPAGRYAQSEVLEGLSALAREAGAESMGARVLCLGYAGLAVREICARIDPAVYLGTRPWRAAVVGFDAGDFLIVRSLERAG